MAVMVNLSEEFRVFLDLHRQSRQLCRDRGGYPGDLQETPEEVEMNGRIAQQWDELSNEDGNLWLLDYRDNTAFWASL